MKDVELGPDEKALIAVARAANAPTEVQRARISRGLAVKLAAGAAAPTLAGSTALATVGKIGAGVAIVAAMATGTAYVVASRPAHAPAAPPPRHAVVAVAPPSPVVTLPTPTVAPAPVSTQSPARASARTHSQPAKASPQRPETSPAPSVDLAGELALLTQANAAIKRGDVAQASQLLDGYDQRFPSGRLAEERSAAGILVLCATGRTESARVEARRFLERWPRSPLVSRIKASCAAEGRAP